MKNPIKNTRLSIPSEFGEGANEEYIVYKNCEYNAENVCYTTKHKLINTHTYTHTHMVRI